MDGSWGQLGAGLWTRGATVLGVMGQLAASLVLAALGSLRDCMVWGNCFPLAPLAGVVYVREGRADSWRCPREVAGPECEQ